MHIHRCGCNTRTVGIRCLFRVKCLLGCKNLKRFCFSLPLSLSFDGFSFLHAIFYLYLVLHTFLTLFIPKKNFLMLHSFSLARWLLFSFGVYTLLLFRQVCKVLPHSHTHIFTLQWWKNRSSYQTDFEQEEKYFGFFLRFLWLYFDGRAGRFWDLNWRKSKARKFQACFLYNEVSIQT